MPFCQRFPSPRAHIGRPMPPANVTCRYRVTGRSSARKGLLASVQLAQVRTHTMCSARCRSCVMENASFRRHRNAVALPSSFVLRVRSNCSPLPLLAAPSFATERQTGLAGSSGCCGQAQCHRRLPRTTPCTLGRYAERCAFDLIACSDTAALPLDERSARRRDWNQPRVQLRFNKDPAQFAARKGGRRQTAVAGLSARMGMGRRAHPLVASKHRAVISDRRRDAARDRRGNTVSSASGRRCGAATKHEPRGADP